MKPHLVLKNRFFNTRLVLFLVVLLVLFLFINTKRHFYAKMIYLNHQNDAFSMENRKVIYHKSREIRVANFIDEFLLGAESPLLKEIFPLNSKRLGSVLDHHTLYINFSKDVLNDIDRPELAIYSLVNSVCMYDRHIKRVVLYVDDVLYRFIGNYGPIDKGVVPNFYFSSS